MGHAAEKLPMPGEEKKNEIMSDEELAAREAEAKKLLEDDDEIMEVTADMVVPGALDDSLEVADSLREKDEVKEALEDLDKTIAESEAAAERKAILDAKEQEGREAMKKKMAQDKRSADMKDLRAKLAAPKGEKKPIPVPPGFEKPAGMTDEFVHELSQAKDLMGSGHLPKGFAEGFEKAYYGLKNAEDAVEQAGFLKKFGLRRKLKKARAAMKDFEDQMTDARLDVQKDKRAANAPKLSEEEKRTQEKRWMHRQGFKR